MRCWPLALVCGVASCGWIAGLPSYGESNDAAHDATRDVAVDAAPACSRGIGGSGCARSLTAGVGATCAIGSDALYCWGQMLPTDGGGANAATAYTIGSPPSSVQLSSTNDGTNTIGTGCYQADEALWCWGNNYYDQVQQETPVVDMPVMVQPAGVGSYAVGGDHVCVVVAGDTTIQCWGRSDLTELDEDVSLEAACAGGPPVCEPTPVAAANATTDRIIVAGRAHTCVSPNVELSQATSCWGDNTLGQLGNPATAGESSEAVPVDQGSVSLGSATSLALGATHSCAIVDGNTYCWGANDSGQLGNGNTMEVSTAALTASQQGLQTIAAGTATTCGVNAAGEVWCWGANARGQAGQPPDPTDMLTDVRVPAQVLGISNARAIAVGDTHACAELGDGDILCWGDNQSGELGDGSATHGHSECGAGDCSWLPVSVKKQ